MKKLFYRTFSIFSIPALILHELAHIVALILTLHTFRKIEITVDPTYWEVSIGIHRLKGRNIFEESLISLFPLFFILMTMYISSIFCPYVIVYLLLTVFVSLPSEDDIKNIFNYEAI